MSDDCCLVGYLLSMMSVVYTITDVDVGYNRRCWRSPLLSLLSMRLVRCLRSELDATGHVDALEIPLLLSSDVVAADVELDQRPFYLVI
jgi:hypothetical protein